MTDDENTTQSADGTPDELVCTSCGLPLHVLRGGMQIGSDGASIVSVAVWGCTNALPCPLFMQEQARTDTPINTFDG